VLPALALLFFCSGTSALIYQLLWVRLFGWVFGVTTYAASAVWASFMIGLAGGSFAAGRIADRVRRPLRWFAAAELLVGITGLSTPFVLSGLQRAYITLYPALPHSTAALTVARFTIALIVLAVPTAMMGATLPLVLKSSEFRLRSLGSRVGTLYGSNTAGAIAGTLAAGLFFIPSLGIHRTFLVAGALNGLVASAAFLLDRFHPPNPVEPARIDSNVNPAQSDAPPTRLQLAVVLGVFTLSGLVSLALEVVWFRVLTLFLRPTVYGFAVMLAAILSGIAIGSYVAAAIVDRRRGWIGVLAWLQFATATAALLSFRFLVLLPSLTDRLTPTLSKVMPEYLVFPVAGSLLAIFPTALLMGVSFPIGLRVWSGGAGVEAVATRTGQFYAMNVGGATLGSLLAGFILLPAIGSRATLTVVAAATFLSGVALVAVWRSRQATKAIALAAGTAAFGAALLASPDPFAEFVAQRYPGAHIVAREEGVEATVVVHDAHGERSLTVNGNHQASTDAATTYVHRRIGHLPMAIHPHPASALVIGLGGGATAGAVAIHGADVDVVELAGSVVRGAAYFTAINYDVLSRPNAHLRVDDGRNFMLLTQRRYDVVTADVIHPIYAGSGNLYSKEYFELMRQVLNPGGIAMQWTTGTDAEYKIIARTFLSVFPETTVWADGSLLVGSVEPLRLRREDFDRKLQHPGSAQGLRDLNVESFDRLLAAYVAGPRELRAFVGDGPVLTDDRPLVEYFLSLPRDRDVDTSSLKGDVSRYVVPE
jgi:spermidine synthase